MLVKVGFFYRISLKLLYTLKELTPRENLQEVDRLNYWYIASAKLYFWSFKYLGSIVLVFYLKFDLFWSFNFYLLHILIISVSFNSKTLGFLHLLLLFFIFISSPPTFNNKNLRKILEENKEDLTFFN